MGLSELIKSATNKNPTNARLLSQFSRRATSIAADAERSNDTAKKQRLEVIVANLDRDFGDMPASTGIGSLGVALAPALYERRKEMIFQADTELNALQQMEEAAKKDQKNLDKEVKAIRESLTQASVHIQNLNAVLPTQSSLHQDPEYRKALSSVFKDTSIDNLRTSIVAFNNRVAALEKENVIDEKYTFTLRYMHTPDKEENVKSECPICEFWNMCSHKLAIPVTYTFGELRDDWMSREGAEEEADIPDFWIEQQGSQRNHITKTGRFWDLGEDNVTIGDAFKAAGIHSNQPHFIDVVENEKDYVVALLEDNGVE
ncbi:1287_t:CDS:2, partial [Acaulospora colombiana]